MAGMSHRKSRINYV